MTKPAAKQNDQIVATDIHIIMIPSPGGPVPTPLPHPFTGVIDGELSSDVNIEGKPAATQGSTATNQPSHIPQGGPFQTPPSNSATIQTGSATVFINGKPAARMGDTATTCNDPSDLPVGTVVAAGTVFIGG
ncbi:MAG: PAAR domain-containing protein [Caldilineaceae bacterium]|nr:PAAR domain-containing protein [Caldilineaceae bacterium]